MLTYPVFPYLAMRFAFATVTMLPAWWWVQRQPGLLPPDGRKVGLTALGAGLLLGIVLSLGYALQTFGLRWTTAAKAGFITGTSVVLVPIFAALIFRHRPSGKTWFGIALAFIGLALLSLNFEDNLQPNKGDVLTLGCAAAFAVQILLVEYLTHRYDALPLTVGQLLMVVMLSVLFVPVVGESWQRPTGPVLFSAAFTGIFASALAFTVQTVAQRFTEAVHAALIFSAEPIFAALFSFLLTGERFTPRVIVGSALILAGMLVVDLGPYLLRHYKEQGWSWLIRE